MSSCRFLGIPYKITRFRHPKYLIRYSSYIKGGDIITNEELITATYLEKKKVIGKGYSQSLISVKPDQLEYEENDFLSFCGYFPKSMMYRNSKSIPNNPDVRRAVTSLFRTDPALCGGDNFLKILLSPRQMVSGGINTSINHLKLYWSPIRNKMKGAEYYINLLEKVNEDIFRLPQLKLPSKEFLHSVRVNEQSHPGFMTNLMLGHTKRNSHRKVLVFTKHLYELIQHFPIKWCGLYELSGRGKDIKLDQDDYSPALTRIIMIPEYTLTLIGSMFSQLIGNFLKEDPANLLFIGRDISKHACSLIDKKYPFNFNSDWSAFDSSITEDLILAAVGIVRSCFPDDRKVDRVFYFIASSLIHKYVVFPKGGVWCIKKGLPSGHPLTSLVETICNALGWIDIMYQIWGPEFTKNVKFWLSGDDARFITKWNPQYIHLNKVITEHTNFVIKDNFYDKFSFQFPLDQSYGADFLKRYISIDGGVIWRIDLISRKLCIPEYEDEQDVESLTRFENYLRTAPGFTDYEYQKFMIELGCRIESRVSRKKSSYKDIITYKERLERLFSNSRQRLAEAETGESSGFTQAIKDFEAWQRIKDKSLKYEYARIAVDDFLIFMRSCLSLQVERNIRRGISSYVSRLTDEFQILPNAPPSYKHFDFLTWYKSLDPRILTRVEVSAFGELRYKQVAEGEKRYKMKDFIFKTV